ncbi:hypothetical protein FRB99_006799 [Tulasnella sp. 403]|nr:hypothetical protein FRB99_006799 [Tulasnella sp. 403]
MAEPTKRILTEATYSLNNPHLDSPTSPTYVDQDLNNTLQNVGRKVRQSVSEGYRTHRNTPLPDLLVSGSAHPFHRTQDDSIITNSGYSTASYHFRSDVDNIHAAAFSYANQSRGLRPYCEFGEEPTWGPDVTDERSSKKRGANGLDEDGEGEDQVMEMATSRPVRPAPRRGMMRGTQSMPVGAFAFQGSSQNGTAMPAGFGNGLVRQTGAPASGNGERGGDPDFGDLFDNPVEF